MTELGSIRVPIQATIEGYQASLEKMKKALQQVASDSILGDSLIAQINSVEKRLKKLGQVPTLKISSPVQLEKLNTELSNIAETMLGIGQQFQHFESFDIDMSAWAETARQAANEMRHIQQEVENLSSSDPFTKFKSDAQELLQALNIDSTTLNLDNWEKALAEGISHGKQQIQSFIQRVDELKQHLSDLVADELQMQDHLQKYTFNGQAFPEFVNKALFTGAGGAKALFRTENRPNQEQVENIQNQLIASINHIQINDVRQALIDRIRNIFSTIDYRQVIGPELGAGIFNNLTRGIRVNGTSYTSADVKSWFSGFDLNSLKQTETYTSLLSTQVERFTENLNTLLANVKNFGMQAQEVEDFIQRVTDAFSRGHITETYNLVANEINRAVSDKNIFSEQRAAIHTEIDKTNAQRATAETNVNAIQSQISDLKAAISQRDQKIEELTARINELSEIIARDAPQNIKQEGSQISQDTAATAERAAAAMAQYKDQLNSATQSANLFNRAQMLMQRYFSIYAVIRHVTKAIKQMKKTIQELDKTMTEIAIVTNMTQQQLWNQVDAYAEMANKYASSISGAYQVSQLYYQQGLQTNDVMVLTEQTLKMARISGLKYADATNYMTNAIRSFKMEMTDAQKIVDVYSAIAATSATSSQELAIAMSKTASSAQAVGSSFENTTAMIAVMMEATREAPENIGTAMKSIISRYGEMTSDPSAVKDSEGEELSLNKVDKALQSVGISIHDANNEFRNFDDVIMDLAKSWDTIDKNTQRYYKVA